MIKARTAPGLSSPSNSAASRRTTDIVGLCLFFGGATCLLWLTLHDTAYVANGVDYLLRLFAGTGAYAIPIIMMFVGTMFLVGFDRLSFSHSSYGSLLLFLAYAAWRHMAATIPLGLSPEVDRVAWSDAHVMHAGGYVGAVLGSVFLRLLGVAGSYLLLGLMVCVSAVLLFDRPFRDLVRQVTAPAAAGYGAAMAGVGAVTAATAARRQRRTDALPPAEARTALARSGSEAAAIAEAPTGGARQRGLLSTFRRSPMPTTEDEAEAPGEPRPVEDSEAADANGRAATRNGSADSRRASSRPSPDEPLLDTAPDVNITFKLPPLSLLKESPAGQPKRSQQELSEKKHKIEETLEQFGIAANVVEIANGPTVTRYEVQLAPGIKVSKIVSLADNLAMSLAAIDVRVEAPIPGKAAIGIEAPNASPAVVPLREVIDTQEFRSAPSKLTFALGKDVSGVNRYADLTKMPHLLVAGSTNSGKSVCLNVLIASLLYRATPREVQLLMIDPKRVELSLWDGIPHLMHPVVKDVKQAAGIFRAALKEMERRYDLFSKIGTRNIDGYNQRMTQEEREDDRLPYVVIVVDELADLMMQAAAEVETSICRLAQLARATGIHLVIATQRPSVDVITGLIKANISSRIAFAVSSQIDSRTILDMNGAERLIGRGDMLFLPIDASKPTRIQGCYLSEQETNALVDYLKQQERPNYSMTAMEVSVGGAPPGAMEDDSDDELFESAVRLVVTNGQCSTSMLQRRFKIGYTRAARLVDIMQEKGIVGALDGAKPREILMSRDEIDRMFRGEFSTD